MAASADLLVVGLGAVGSAALYRAAKLGLRAIGIDRFHPPHDRGSSHGESRITRQAIGEGQEYVPLVLRSIGFGRSWRRSRAALFSPAMERSFCSHPTLWEIIMAPRPSWLTLSQPLKRAELCMKF